MTKFAINITPDKLDRETTMKLNQIEKELMNHNSINYIGREIDGEDNIVKFNMEASTYLNNVKIFVDNVVKTIYPTRKKYQVVIG